MLRHRHQRPTEAVAVRQCKRGHDLTPENIYTPKNGYSECRMCRRVVKQEWDAKRTLTTDEVIEIAKQVAAGKTLVDKENVSGNAIFNERESKYLDWVFWARNNPRAAREIRKLAHSNRNRNRSENRRERLAIPICPPIKPHELDMTMIDAALPKRWRGEMREEIQQRLVIDMLEGRCSYETLAARAQFHFGAYFDDYADRDGPLSLDLPVRAPSGSSRMTLADTVTRGLWS